MPLSNLTPANINASRIMNSSVSKAKKHTTSKKREAIQASQSFAPSQLARPSSSIRKAESQQGGRSSSNPSHVSFTQESPASSHTETSTNEARADRNHQFIPHAFVAHDRNDRHGTSRKREGANQPQQMPATPFKAPQRHARPHSRSKPSTQSKPGEQDNIRASHNSQNMSNHSEPLHQANAGHTEQTTLSADMPATSSEPEASTSRSHKFVIGQSPGCIQS